MNRVNHQQGEKCFLRCKSLSSPPKKETATFFPNSDKGNVNILKNKMNYLLEQRKYFGNLIC